jgi:tripartite-type tricarboxylate transporter receptor subunit TctC
MNRERGITRVVSLSCLALCIISITIGVGLAAEKFPSREMIIVVPYPAGGPVGLPFNALAEYLKKDGVPVVVEYRPEAGSVKGVVDVYRAKPDGYTLLANLLPRNAIQEVVTKPPYKILDMTYLPAFAKNDMFVAVLKDSPHKTLKDLAAASKKKSLNCGIPGIGSLSHFDAVLLKNKVGIDLEVVPFKGGAQTWTALLGGNVDMITGDDLSMFINKEKIRPLAIFSDKRASKFPDVPTFNELGYETLIGYAVMGVSAPPGMPQELRTVISNLLTKSMKNPELMGAIDKMGPTPIYMTGPDFSSLAKSYYKFVEDYKNLLEEK